MEKHLKTATVLAHVLDSNFKFMKRRFGLNGILGLIPVVGDLLVTVLSLYLVWIAVKLKLPTIKIIHMLWNILVNFIIGLLPILGDFVDFFHKANLKNLKILKTHTERDVIEGEILE